MRYRTKTVYRRAKRAAGGKFKPLIDGAMAEVACDVASKYAGNDFGAIIGYGGIGYWRKNTTLMTLAGMALGNKLSGMIPFIGGKEGTGGVFE